MSSFPEYETPPVVEVVLAVEFVPLPGWNPVFYGSLWERFRANYPTTEVQPMKASPQPIPQSEQPIVALPEPPLRYFFKNPDASQMVQVRSGAFIRNWRAVEGGSYPRYHNIRPAFERDLNIFLEYVKDEGFGSPEFWKCEVTYVNHFVKGREWSEWSEVPNLVPGFAPSAKPGILGPRTQMQSACRYDLLGGLGRLLVQMIPALSAVDGSEIIQFSLEASGAPASSSVTHLMDWLDQGREAIVTSFAELTAEQAQSKFWGRVWHS